MDFHSHGKLLITGEYLVLRGATALAAPVRLGQKMSIMENTGDQCLRWESFEMDNCWFTARIDTSFFQITETNKPEVAYRLLKLLVAANDLNPGFLNSSKIPKGQSKS